MRPRAGAWLLGAAFALAIADSVYQIPIQVSDSLDVIVEAAETPDAVTLFAAAVEGSSSTLRPLRYNQAQWLVWFADRTGLSYHHVFRGAHAILAAMIVLLLVHLVPTPTWPGVAALGVSLVIATGHHTFVALLREAYPVNHYAQVTACGMMSYALARRRPGWPVDAALAIMLVYHLFLTEFAILLWVLVGTAYVVRLPGVRRSTVVVTTLLVGAWALTRLALGIVAPAIGGQGSGFGGTYYEGAELNEMFGDRSLAFAAYNLVGSVASVLMSEPRHGVFVTLQAARTGALQPVTVIHIAASLAATMLLGWYLSRRLPRTRQHWGEPEQLVVMAVVMIVASALLTSSYVKDEMLSVGAIFSAAAASVALLSLFERANTVRWGSALLLAVSVATGAALWSFRSVGVHYVLRSTAFVTRHDWSEDVRPHQFPRWSQTPAGLRIVADLREEVLMRPVAGRYRLPPWGDRFWGE